MRERSRRQSSTGKKRGRQFYGTRPPNSIPTTGGPATGWWTSLPVLILLLCSSLSLPNVAAQAPGQGIGTNDNVFNQIADNEVVEEPTEEFGWGNWRPPAIPGDEPSSLVPSTSPTNGNGKATEGDGGNTPTLLPSSSPIAAGASPSPTTSSGDPASNRDANQTSLLGDDTTIDDDSGFSLSSAALCAIVTAAILFCFCCGSIQSDCSGKPQTSDYDINDLSSFFPPEDYGKTNDEEVAGSTLLANYNQGGRRSQPQQRPVDRVIVSSQRKNRSSEESKLHDDDDLEGFASIH